ncbi:nucleotidyltransferase family protein [Malaciobacter mytili]|uniref:nucleotidyltransferase family protein n=1 Tax=Malaciobacter mytili TaxID=603050 RepID=UPI003A857392
MKALLLAAGFGTRLRPITNTIPKCLVPINNKPLLQYWLENLTKVGVTEFLINTHYLHKEVEKFVEQSIFKKQITLSYEKNLLNTGGTLLANKDFFNKDEPFMLIHADNFCFCDFNEFINSHKNSSYDLTMMLFRTKTPSSCGIVKLDENAIVKEFYEKVNNPPSNLANAAVYICNYKIFTFLESLNKKEIDFSLDVIPNYLGKINTFINNNYHIDIGTPETYAEAQNFII